MFGRTGFSSRNCFVTKPFEIKEIREALEEAIIALGGVGKIQVYKERIKCDILQRDILYCEPCGYYCLSDQILGEDSKKLSISNYEKKGQVCKESIVSEKIVKHLLFSKMELCYHYSSLGPVYYKQI